MKVASVIYPYCHKVLPLTYDDSLSYYESICKLVSKINEVIEQFDDWSEVIAQLQEAIKDIDDMKTDISELQSGLTSVRSDISSMNTVIQSLDAYVKALEKRYDERFKEDEDSISRLVQIINNLNTSIDAKINALRQELTDLFNSFTDDFTEELQMLQLKVNQMKINLQGQIDELRATVDEINTKVINPWHIELGKISQQKNTELMYRDLADHEPLAKEYSMLNMSADEYSVFGMTALEYATEGYKKLHLDWVFSPTFGWRQEVNNVLTSIVTWLSDTITANVYAETGLDADGYSALDMSAQDYYKFKPERIGLFVEDGVLQSQQYSLVEVDGVLQVFGGTATETDGVLTVT